MRYMIREKFFRIGEDSTIMNEVGQPIMQVDGKVLSLHDRLIVRIWPATKWSMFTGDS